MSDAERERKKYIYIKKLLVHILYFFQNIKFKILFLKIYYKKEVP